MNVAVKEQVKGKIKVKEKIKKEKVKELQLATIAVEQVTNQMNAVAREKARQSSKCSISKIKLSTSRKFRNMARCKGTKM